MVNKKQKLKINLAALELGHLSDTVVAGGDLLLERMSPYMSKIQITVIVPKIGFAHWQNRNAKIITLKKNWFDKSLFKPAIFLSYLIRTLQAYKKLSNIKFDILYSSTNIFPDIFTAFLFKTVHKNTFWVARIHHRVPKPTKREGNVSSNIFAYLIERLILVMCKRANLIITLNSDLFKELELLGFNKSKIAISGGGVNLSLLKKAKPSNTNYDAIFVGRLHVTKGIFDSLEIWQGVSTFFPGVKLGIVGEGKPAMIKELKKQIRKRRLTKNVDLLGVLPEVELYRTLKSSKVFLFVDKEAGWGLAVAEAMAAGIPVIGWDIGILGKIFKKGFLTVVPFNCKKFTEVVVKLLKNDKHHKRLSSQAKLEAKNFDWPKVSKELEKILIKF